VKPWFLAALCASLATPLASEEGAAGEPRLVIQLRDVPLVDRIEVERVWGAPAGRPVRGEASAILADGSMVSLSFRRDPPAADDTERWDFRRCHDGDRS
jgi:hypothetical protein